MNIDVIKRIAINAFNASNPVNVLIGTVSKTSPLEIEIHQKLKLPKEFLVMTERVTQPGLIKGDKVVLLRVQGGHQFVVLDKVVD